MSLILKDDPRFDAARKVLEAMHAFWKLQPFSGAVQWIEDTDGRLVVFTRGEYKQRIREAIAENMKSESTFELYDPDEDE